MCFTSWLHFCNITTVVKILHENSSQFFIIIKICLRISYMFLFFTHIRRESTGYIKIPVNFYTIKMFCYTKNVNSMTFEPVDIVTSRLYIYKKLWHWDSTIQYGWWKKANISQLNIYIHLYMHIIKTLSCTVDKK